MTVTQEESEVQEESDISDALRDTSIASQHDEDAEWDEEEQGPPPLSHSQKAAAQRVLAPGDPAQVFEVAGEKTGKQSSCMAVSLSSVSHASCVIVMANAQASQESICPLQQRVIDMLAPVCG